MNELEQKNSNEPDYPFPKEIGPNLASTIKSSVFTICGTLLVLGGMCIVSNSPKNNTITVKSPNGYDLAISSTSSATVV